MILSQKPCDLFSRVKANKNFASSLVTNHTESFLLWNQEIRVFLPGSRGRQCSSRDIDADSGRGTRDHTGWPETRAFPPDTRGTCFQPSSAPPATITRDIKWVFSHSIMITFTWPVLGPWRPACPVSPAQGAWGSLSWGGWRARRCWCTRRGWQARADGGRPAGTGLSCSEYSTTWSTWYGTGTLLVHV